MKTSYLWCVLSVVLLAAFAVVAQTSTNGVPVTELTALPTSLANFWTYGIAVIVPLIVGGFKKLVPKIPTWALPVSTPFIGIALGAGLKALGAHELTWVDTAQAGGLAVLVRESWNQIVTKRIHATTDSTA